MFKKRKKNPAIRKRKKDDQLEADDEPTQSVQERIAQLKEEQQVCAPRCFGFELNAAWFLVSRTSSGDRFGGARQSTQKP